MATDKKGDDERRIRGREERYGDIAFSDANAPGGTSTEGVVVNMSDSGLSIVAERPLQKGTKLSLRIKGLWNKPKPVTVIWCKQRDDRSYQIGVTVDG